VAGLVVCGWRADGVALLVDLTELFVLALLFVMNITTKVQKVVPPKSGPPPYPLREI
jgi:hypothetical protein